MNSPSGSGKGAQNVKDILKRLGIEARNAGVCVGADRWIQGAGRELASVNPATNEVIATVMQASAADYDTAVTAAQAGFEQWRLLPAPKRGEVIRDLGNALREYKVPLGELVTLESGKIREEGLGEVQEMIDICDFAVGLSRQLYGLDDALRAAWATVCMSNGILSVPSESSPPLIFRVAVWSWNAAIAAVCGDTMIWKPSPSTPLDGDRGAAYLQSRDGEAQRRWRIQPGHWRE